MVFFPFEGNNFSPHFLSSRILLYFIVALLGLKIISLAVLFNIPKNFYFAEVSQSALILETNQNRANLGLGILKESKVLDQAALMKAQDMLRNQYFAHQSPAGVTPWYWFKTLGYNYKYAGENLAIGFFDSQEVYQAWLDSPTHKANLLNPNYKEIGVAVLNGNFEGKSTTIVVQLFGNPQVVGAISTVKKPVVTTKPETTPASTPVTTVVTKPVVDEEVLGEAIESPTLRALDQVKIDSSWRAKIINFALYSQDSMLKTIAFVFLILILAILMFDTYLNLDKQNSKSRARVLSFVLILCFISFVDRNFLIQILPHTLNV